MIYLEYLLHFNWTRSWRRSSKIILNVVEDDLVTGSITLDNYGNRYTAKQRSTVKIDVNNPSKTGDKLSITKTFNTGQKFDYSQFDTRFRWKKWFKSICFSFKTWFEIGKELKTNPVSIGVLIQKLELSTYSKN